VSLAGQEADEAAEPGLGRPALLGAQPARDERPSGRLLGLRVQLQQALTDRLVVDTLAAQLAGQRPTGQPATVMAAGHPGPRKSPVVDDAHLVVALEHVLRHVGRYAAP